MFRYIVAGLILVGWAVLGDPERNVANLFWPNTPAPWETVDGVFYPDRFDLTYHEEEVGLEDLDACRDWAQHRAIEIGDRAMRKSGYECGFGFIRHWGGGKVYRGTNR